MSDTVVVVDANLALKWVLLEADSHTSILLLDKWTDEGTTVIAPALFAYEVTNILYRQTVSGKLTYDESRRGLEKLFSLDIRLTFSLYEEVSAQAMEFARRFHLPATYDAHYLALAYAEQCECWTADRRLWNAVKRELVWVRWLGEYQPDALAAFFAKLGYDTNDRLVQNVAAMGFTSDNLKSAITHIERLASQDARLFEVYLFELKSVTVANTQGIVRAFRNRPGDYLLILTDDYQRLDFVLVERYTAEISRSQPQETFSMNLSVPKQVGIRPRVLTVNRRNPEDVALRVLRRFSYTESDTFAQYDKLLSAYDVADWSEPFFNNRALFSDYYLSTRLPSSPEWKSSEEAGAMTRAFKTLRELYADVRGTFSNQPENTVRAKLLEPVLTTLGFIQQSVTSKNSPTAQPDYKLFAATPAHDKPLALCLAYTWGRNLDGKDEQRDSQTPDENPGAVVVS